MVLYQGLRRILDKSESPTKIKNRTAIDLDDFLVHGIQKDGQSGVKTPY